MSDSFVKNPSSIERELEEQRKATLLEEMGLEDRSVERLKRTLFSPDEAVAAKTEELRTIRQHKGRRDHWQEFIDAKRRMGRVLHHSEVVRGLGMIVRGFFIARGGQRGRIGLYTVRNVPAEEIEGYRGSSHQVECPIYLGWCDLGYLPEYEIDVVNDVMVAVGQRRGWRTILLNLIARRDRLNRPSSVVTERQVLRAFGEPSNGETASFYRRRLWEFRNGR